jgi:cytochrome c oxidase subunit 3
MTVALRAATVEMRRLTLVFLATTAVLGVAFLICKGLEYREDLKEHLFPGPEFPLSPPATQMFWGFYWVMTGIHAVHLSAGIAVVLGVFALFKRNIIPVQGSTMEGVAIYWHFVDSVWLVLFPLLYLAGRS